MKSKIIKILRFCAFYYDFWKEFLTNTIFGYGECRRPNQFVIKEPTVLCFYENNVTEIIVKEKKISKCSRKEMVDALGIEATSVYGKSVFITK